MNNRKVTKEMREKFSYIPSGKLAYEVKYSEYKTERGLMKHLAKVNEECKRIVEMPDVKFIDMSISWTRSRTWGMNPHLEGSVQFTNREWHYANDISCGGCGYDKLSSVMADFLNRYLRGMLWRRRNFRTHTPPYGVDYTKGWFPHFEGGVGKDCTISVLEWLGFTVVANQGGKTWDYFELKR